MSKIKNDGLDQYGAGPSERQQFGTAGVEGVNKRRLLGLQSVPRKQQDHTLPPPGVAAQRHNRCFDVLLRKCHSAISRRYSITRLYTSKLSFVPRKREPTANPMCQSCHIAQTSNACSVPTSNKNTAEFSLNYTNTTDSSPNAAQL